MNPFTHVRARALIAALSLSLTALAASPVVALATAAPECDPVAADAATSAARGPAGKLVEPVLAQAGKEAPKGPANRPGFNETIPVYFHVISNGTDGAVSTGTIAQQMDVLNQSYAGKQGGADTGFKFSLAGVNFATNATWFNAGPGSAGEAEMKQALKQGGAGDMNVYTTSGEAFLGWAYFPSIVGSNFEYLDGVVIDFRSMPGGPYGDAFSLGGTLTHEAGHYLGLYHTFQGGCSTKGDLVADTPAQRTPTGGCPEGKDTCTGKPGLDPIHNYMDYSFDSCYNQFTPGQGSRMQDQFLAFRA